MGIAIANVLESIPAKPTSLRQSAVSVSFRALLHSAHPATIIAISSTSTTQKRRLWTSVGNLRSNRDHQTNPVTTIPVETSFQVATSTPEAE